MQNKNDINPSNIKAAYLNDVQLLRFYRLCHNRQFLHQQIEKKIIQNLEPINIKPKHIINLGADLTLNHSYHLDIEKYDLYKNLPHVPQVTHILPNQILNNKYKLPNNLSNPLFSNFNKLSNIVNKAKNFILPNNRSSKNSDIIYTDNILNIPDSIKPNTIDIIYSNLSLNYYTDLSKIFETWSKVLNNQGLIIFSLFSIGSANKLPFNLPLIDMHDIGDMLVHNKFSNPVIHTQKIHLDYKNSNIKAILKDLQAFGLLFNIFNNKFDNNINLDSANLNYNKLCSLFSQINSIELEIVYAHAWKKIDKSITNGEHEQIISIDKLRHKL